ncbi:MAG: hypothetical protein AAB354_04515 [candidate division KSB1 bacterium]
MTKNENQAAATSQTLSRVGTNYLGIYLLILPVLLAYLVIQLWPSQRAGVPLDQASKQNRQTKTRSAAADTKSSEQDSAREKKASAQDTTTHGSTAQSSTAKDSTGQAEDRDETQVALFGGKIEFSLSLEARYILLIMLLGALGSYVHLATSFVDYVGNNRMARSWLWWYILRAFIGMALALVFYFVIRGGFLSAGATSADLNLYGIAAISGLAGMFSKQATDKLREVADNLFSTKAGDQRKDKLAYPIPEVTAILPDPIPIGAKSMRIEVKGKNFVKESILRADGADLKTDFINENQLVGSLPTEKLAAAGRIKITVFNPSQGGGESNEIEREIK